jgi:hypothetical protein
MQKFGKYYFQSLRPPNIKYSPGKPGNNEIFGAIWYREDGMKLVYEHEKVNPGLINNSLYSLYSLEGYSGIPPIVTISYLNDTW